MKGLSMIQKTYFYLKRAPKLKPINPDKGMQGVKIFSCLIAMSLAS